MKQAVGLRSYAQKDPLNEYKREAFILFESMLANLRQTTTSVMAHVELRAPDPEPWQTAAGRDDAHQKKASGPGASGQPDMQPSNTTKTPRNSPCPCGSGLKFKHCHGKF